MRLRLLGRMDVRTEAGESVLPPGRKTRALLALLALSPRAWQRSRLAETLWSRRPEMHARASLRQEVHRLLDVLTPAGMSDALIVSRDTLGLRRELVWMDVDDVLRATRYSPASLALYEGELLEDLDGVDQAFDSWLSGERDRLRDRVRGVAEEVMREQTEPDEMARAAQRLLDIDRAHEGAWRTLMRAYNTRGERGLAVQAYERCRAALAERRGAEPSEETRRVLAEVRGEVLPAPEPAASPPPSAQAPSQFPESRPATVLPFTSARQGGPRGFAEIQGTLAAPADAPAPASTANVVRVNVRPLVAASSGAPEFALAAGLTEEITAVLSRARWLSVLRGVDASKSDGLTLEGAVQETPGRARVSLRLIEPDGVVVWAGRFDGDLNDRLRLQDDIAAQAAAQIDTEVVQLLIGRAASRAGYGQGLEPDEHLRLALPLMMRLERAALARAMVHIDQAIAAAPENAFAQAMRAAWGTVEIAQGWAEDEGQAGATALACAGQAMLLDPQDARVLSLAGLVRAVLARAPQEAAEIQDRALALNPALAVGWGLSAFTHLFLGALDESERRYQRYKFLLPVDPYSFLIDGVMALVHLLRDQHDKAVGVGRMVSQLHPNSVPNFKMHLVALAEAGRADEAALVARKVMSMDPHFSVSRFRDASPFMRAGDTDRMANAFIRAGIPEHAIGANVS